MNFYKVHFEGNQIDDVFCLRITFKDKYKNFYSTENLILPILFFPLKLCWKSLHGSLLTLLALWFAFSKKFIFTFQFILKMRNGKTTNKRSKNKMKETKFSLTKCSDSLFNGKSFQNAFKSFSFVGKLEKDIFLNNIRNLFILKISIF